MRTIWPMPIKTFMRNTEKHSKIILTGFRTLKISVRLESKQSGLFRMLVHKPQDCWTSMDPFLHRALIPISTTYDVLYEIEVCKFMTRIPARSLLITMDAREAKDVVKRFITLSREHDCWSESPNIHGEMDEEVKLRLANQNTWGAEGCYVEKIFDCA